MDIVAIVGRVNGAECCDVVVRGHVFRSLTTPKRKDVLGVWNMDCAAAIIHFKTQHKRRLSRLMLVRIAPGAHALWVPCSGA